MELETALRLLDLPRDPTRQQLQTAYRRLVKRYHPDANPRRPQWAHTMMTRVHAAYIVASDHVSGPASARSESAPNTDFGAVEREVQRLRQQTSRHAEIIRGREAEAKDVLHYYYAHGLEQIHLRTQGSQHLRYRRAMRRLAAVATLLRKECPKSGPLRDRATALMEFVNAFYASARAPGTGPTVGEEYAAYRHFARGADLLDGAIRSTLFPDLRDSRSIRGGALSLAFHELMLVLSTYRASFWVSEAAVRLRLLDAFVAYRNSEP